MSPIRSFSSCFTFFNLLWFYLPPCLLLLTESTPDTPGAEGLTTEAVSQCEVSVVGETLEDMSLSSNSSLDKNDTSQEYMDDFDNLGNPIDGSFTSFGNLGHC